MKVIQIVMMSTMLFSAFIACSGSDKKMNAIDCIEKTSKTPEAQAFFKSVSAYKMKMADASADQTELSQLKVEAHKAFDAFNKKASAEAVKLGFKDTAEVSNIIMDLAAKGDAEAKVLEPRVKELQEAVAAIQ